MHFISEVCVLADRDGGETLGICGVYCAEKTTLSIPPHAIHCSTVMEAHGQVITATLGYNDFVCLEDLLVISEIP